MKYIRTLALACALVVASCATVPETGRHQLILVDPDQLLQMSLSEFDQMKKDTPISKDPAQNELVTRVGKRIASVVNLPNAKWEFVVFDKPDVMNAFCLP